MENLPERQAKMVERNKMRARYREIPYQIKVALLDAEEITHEPLTELTVAKMAFIKSRLEFLSVQDGRTRKTKQLTEERDNALAEIARLKVEIEQLKASPAVRPLSSAEATLAKYHAERASEDKSVTVTEMLAQAEANRKVLEPEKSEPEPAPPIVKPKESTEQDKKWELEAAHRADMQSVIAKLDAARRGI